MDKIDIAGLKIDALTKPELLAQLEKNIVDGKKTWITTPYSEFLYAALLDPAIMDLLNRSNIAVPDGIGLFWAKRFLDLPLTAKSYPGKILQASWQAFYTLCAVILYPSYIRSALPEKISGADLVWDLAKFACDKNLSIYLLGGFGDTPKLAADKLQNSTVCFIHGREGSKRAKFNLAGWSNKNPDDPAVIADIKKAAPDILLVAYGPLKQERWIAEHLPELPIKLAIGLGGTFDYLAGKVPNPPGFLRKIGLEWLYRLITQPHRAGRIYNALFGLVSALIHHKVFMSYPWRKNVVSIIINDRHQTLIFKRHPNNFGIDLISKKFNKEEVGNYWQFSQGGIDDGEDIFETAKRELKEETGIKDVEPIKISDRTYTYLWNNALRKFSTNRKYRNRGQIQNIAYFKFTGNNHSIAFDTHPQKIEFCDFKWVDIGALPGAVHPERRAVAKIALEDLKEMREKGII